VRVHERVMWDALGKPETGVERIPKALRNEVTHKSKKGLMGQIVVRKFTGIEKNKGSAYARQFEQKIGDSHEGIATKLEASLHKDHNESIATLVKLLRNPGGGKPSLGNLVARSGADLASVVTRYAQGEAILSGAVSMIELAREWPRVLRDLVRQAVAKEGMCYSCLGSGKVPGRQYKQKDKEWLPCETCGGDGKYFRFGENYRFAVETSAKIMKAIEPPSAPTVNVTQQTAVLGGGGRFMERLIKTSDNILYGRKSPEDVVDVQPEPGQSIQDTPGD